MELQFVWKIQASGKWDLHDSIFKILVNRERWQGKKLVLIIPRRAE